MANYANGFAPSRRRSRTKPEPMLRSKLHTFTLLLLLPILLCPDGMVSHAKPAWRGKVRVTQKDGTTFLAKVHGDEFTNYLTTLDGHAVTKDGEGLYCYCIYSPEGIPTSTGYMVGERAVPSSILSASTRIPRDVLLDNSSTLRRLSSTLRNETRREGRRELSTKAVDGDSPTYKCIVVLAEFQDKKMTYSREDFEAMLLSDGYSRDGATGSAKEYFDEMFRGDIRLEFVISPIVTMDHGCPYYFGGSDPRRKDQRSAQFVAEACTKAHEAGVDFSQFDGDGDGQVDNVILFAAGQDEAECGDPDCPWSHQWWVKDGGKITCTLDGVLVNRYALATEIGLNGEDADGVATYGFAPIGTFCHEFSHTLGLPDFYDMDGISSGGICDALFYVTDLMDGGCYNNYSRTPPHWGAVDYHLLGLGKEVTLGEGNTALGAVADNRTYIRYDSPTEGEYYLMDVRGEGIWDDSIGSKGLAIYHLDRTDPERWINNKVNIDPSRQLAYLVCPDPALHAFDPEGNRIPESSGALFFPHGETRMFTSKTEPVFSFHGGRPSPLGLTDISYDPLRRMATFTVLAMDDIVIPEIRSERVDIFQYNAILQFSSTDEKSSSPSTVIISSGPPESPTMSDTLSVTPHAAGKYALRLDGLTPGTMYRVSAGLMVNGLAGPKTDLSFETRNLYDSYPYITFKDVPRGEDGSFPEGCAIPLVVYNLEGGASVIWQKDGAVIRPGSDGYYHLWSSGEMTATIIYQDGSSEIIRKALTVK